MPLTKQKNIRFLVIDRCLRNKTKHYTIKDLQEACKEELLERGELGVKERTIYYDLGQIKEIYNTEIESYKDHENRTCYRYADPDFSILNSPINKEELSKLKSIVATLQRFQGIPQFGWTNEVLTRIQNKLYISEVNDNIIEFEGNLNIEALKLLPELFDYIVNHQPLQITYKPFAEDEISWIIHPYYLKQYNTRWYVIAYSEAKQKIVNLALDRIKNIETYDKIAYKETDINFTEYFDEVIGVTIYDNQQPQTIQLSFTPERLPYILTKPIHGSQTTIDKEKGIIKIEVIPNRELEALLLSFGSDVEVLEPSSLRMQIQEKAKQMCAIYSNCK